MRSARWSGCVWSLIVTAAVFVAAGRRAPAEEGMAALARDEQVEVLLRRALELANAGKRDAALKALMLAEDKAAERESEEPELRPVVLGADGRARAVGVVVRERVLALGPQALEAYRAARDPLLERALEEAERNPGGAIERLRRVLPRYALARAGARALLRLADLELERGEIGVAVRRYRRLAEGAADLAPAPQAIRKAASARLEALAGGGIERRRLSGGDWPMRGGDPSRAAVLEHAALPGARVAETEIVGSEVSEEVVRGYERRGRKAPLVYHPVVAGGEVILADAHAVRAFGLGDAKVRWLYVAEGSEGALPERRRVPERLDAMAYSVCVDRDRVYATLNRNEPPVRYEGEEKGKDEDEAEAKPVLARNWRLVALDRKREGRLVWDASRDEALAELSKRASFVSSPLAVEGRLYYTYSVAEAGSVHVYLLALEAEGGELLFRTFVASGRSDDFLREAALPAEPAYRDGLVYVQTNVGALGALRAEDGAIEWVARYRSHPPGTMKRIVSGGHRFRPAPPRVIDGVVCVAALDAPRLFGFDAESGKRLWERARAGLVHMLGRARDRLIVSGRSRVLALEPKSGRVVWRRVLDGGLRLRGAGVCSEDAIVLPAEDRFVVIDPANGRLDPRPRLYAPSSAWSGNLAAAPGALIAVGARRLVVFGDEAKNEAAGGRWGLEAALEAARSGRFEEALQQLARLLENAPERSGLSEAERARARAAALEIGWKGVLATQANDAGGQKAFEVGFSGFSLAAPTGRWAALGRTLAREALRAGRYARALEIYGQLIRRGRHLEVELEGGERAPLVEWARLKIERLRGRQELAAAFAAFDARAERAVMEARRVGEPEVLERTIEAWPGSEAEAKGLLALADLYEARGVGNEARAALLRFLMRYFGRPETEAALERLVAADREAGRSWEAWQTLVRLEQRFGERLGKDSRLRRWIDTTLERLEGEIGLPFLPGSREQNARSHLSFHTPTDLDENEPSVVVLRDPGSPWAKRFLVVGARSLIARDLETGAELWRHRLEGEVALARGGRVGAVWVVAHGPVFEGLDLATGRVRWRIEPKTLEAWARGKAGAAGDEKKPAEEERAASEAGEDATVRDALTPLGEAKVLYGARLIGDRLVVSLRSPSGSTVVGVDASSGKLRWRVEHPAPLMGGPYGVALEGGKRLAVLSAESPARLVGIDVETGRVRYDNALGAARSRLTLGPRAGGRRLFVVLGGNVLAGVDAVRGEVIWRERLAYWPRELVAHPEGEAVAVLPYGVGRHPSVVVLDGERGAPLYRGETGKERVSLVRFDGAWLYVLRGDFRQTRLQAVHWPSGSVRWTWRPGRGNSFRAIELSRSHVVLAQTAPSGPSTVYAVSRERGALTHTFGCGGRRIVEAALAPGVLLVSTNRGVLGFSDLDERTLAHEAAASALRLEEEPGDVAARIRHADRWFELGRRVLAEQTLVRGLEREDIDLAAYGRLHELLVGVRETRESQPELEVSRLARPPEIDGDLNDWWRVDQSLELRGVLQIEPIQGYDTPAVVRGREDLSAVLYLGYDARYFYFALDVDDSSLVPYDSEATTWRGDCLLIAIDSLGNGGEYFMRDDNLLSLALTLPKKNKDPDEQKQAEEDEPAGKYFAKRKDDGSGVTYEVAIPWSSFAERNADIDLETGPRPGFGFGLNLVLTDDDDGQGSRKALTLTPSMALHRDKQRLWQGFVPGRFLRVVCR